MQMSELETTAQFTQMFLLDIKFQDKAALKLETTVSCAQVQRLLAISQLVTMLLLPIIQLL